VTAQSDRQVRILVVDDNRDAADSLAVFLRLEGHDVEVAYGGADALTLAAAHQPHVILMDIAMPGLDGLQTARQLRALDGLGQVRIIAVSGFAHDTGKDAAVHAGFESHLMKPVDTVRLSAILK
jgi:CheY-like chemotaxis protein